MNTGQTMLTIVAIILLSSVILTTNRGLLTTNSTMTDNRYGIIAVSLANSTMEAATHKAFDEQSDTLGLTNTNQLTLPSALGLDGTESINHPENFNDFDDFNCYRNTAKVDSIRLEGTNRVVIFNTKCQVDYVTANNPETISTQRTWHKRIIVKVYSPGIQDTVKMSTVYSYFFFR